jgi:hypothetical protein
MKMMGSFKLLLHFLSILLTVSAVGGVKWSIGTRSSEISPQTHSDAPISSEFAVTHQESAVLKVNAVYFHSELSRKIFRTLLGNATKISDKTETPPSLQNLYKLNALNETILLVEEDSEKLQYFDMAFVYVDHYLLLNDEKLLTVFLEALHSLNTAKNSSFSAEPRSKSVLRIFLNSKKDAYNHVLSVLNEAFLNYYDGGDHRVVFTTMNITEPITQSIHPMIYLVPISHEAEESFAFSPKTLHSLLDLSVNNSIPFRQFLREQQEREQIAKKVPKQIIGLPSKQKSAPSLPTGLPTSLVAQLKDYKDQTLIHVFTKVLDSEGRKALNERFYSMYGGTERFGKTLDKILDEMFHYYHSLIEKNSDLSSFLTLPSIDSSSSSSSSFSSLFKSKKQISQSQPQPLQKKNQPSKELQQIYYYHCYELLSSLCSGVIPVINRQLELLLNTMHQEYQNLLQENEIPISLSMEKELKEFTLKYLNKYKTLCYDLLPKKYYHQLRSSENSKVLSFLTQNPLVNRKKNNSPIFLQWNYDKYAQLLQDELEIVNNRLIKAYQSTGILPYKRTKVTLAVNCLFYHPFGRDFRQDVLLWDNFINDQMSEMSQEHATVAKENYQKGRVDTLQYYSLKPVPGSSNSGPRSGSLPSVNSASLTQSISKNPLLMKYQLEKEINSALQSPENNHKKKQIAELTKKREFVREMAMLSLFIKPAHYRFEVTDKNKFPLNWAHIPNFWGKSRHAPYIVDDFDKWTAKDEYLPPVKREKLRDLYGPERMIRWDLPPLDEVAGNLQKLKEHDEKNAERPFAERVRNKSN